MATTEKARFVICGESYTADQVYDLYVGSIEPTPETAAAFAGISLARLNQMYPEEPRLTAVDAAEIKAAVAQYITTR